MGAILTPESREFREYVDLFIQRIPRYAAKSKWGRWYTVKGALTDKQVQAHLEKRRIIGTLAKWYPGYGILDIDDRGASFAQDLRAEIGMDKTNSMLMTSESDDSYHLLFKPVLDGSPPTAYRLNTALESFARAKGIELYPQKGHAVRLPFGKFQEYLDVDRDLAQTWESKLFWFEELEEFDLGGVPGQQLEMDFTLAVPDKAIPIIGAGEFKGWYQQGADLFGHGLQSPNSRHDSQLRVIYWLWRRNVTMDEAYRQTWAWIRKRHNGFSQEILKHPESVRQEIVRQLKWLYSHFAWTRAYPDSTHNAYNGFITEPDLRDIMRICGGSVPRMRFLFGLVKYSNPRRQQRFLNVHRDQLVKWAHESTYRRYLAELTGKGIAIRGRAYLAGKFSKSIKLKWDYRDRGSAVLREGRAVDSFEGALKLLYSPQDCRSLLRTAGMDRGQLSRYLAGVYGGP